MQDLKPTATFVAAQVDKRYAFSEQVQVIALTDIASALQGQPPQVGLNWNARQGTWF